MELAQKGAEHLPARPQGPYRRDEKFGVRSRPATMDHGNFFRPEGEVPEEQDKRGVQGSNKDQEKVVARPTKMWRAVEPEPVGKGCRREE